MPLQKEFYGFQFLYLIGFTLKQNISFLLLLCYLLFEYLRPQDMYPFLQIFPFVPVILMFSFLSMILEGKIFNTKNKANILILIFFLIILLSSIFSISFESSNSKFKTVFILFFVYYNMVCVVDNLKKYFILLFFFILLTFKLSQSVFISWVLRGFEYDKYGAAVGMAWLKNSGELAVQFCIVFVLSLYLLITTWKHIKEIYKKIILLFIPISTFGGVIACGSRGSFLALAVVIFTIWLTSKKKMSGLIVLIIICLSIPFVISERDLTRTVSMGGAGDGTALSRLERWEKGIEMASRNPVLGVGYGNWADADRLYFDGQGALSHNIFIECVSELGLSGLFVFILLIASTFKNNIETIKIARKYNCIFSQYAAKSLNLALIAYLVAGFFVTILYYPYFWINLAMTISLNNSKKKDIFIENNKNSPK